MNSNDADVIAKAIEHAGRKIGSDIFTGCCMVWCAICFHACVG